MNEKLCERKNLINDINFYIFSNELQAELAEEKRLERIKGRTRLDKLKIYTFRFLVNILVLSLLAASIFAIIKAVEVSSNPVCLYKLFSYYC